ncbi:MAG TPA: hypothetical protein VII22_29310 [Streptosporangiaceae bacterium]
MGYEQLPGHRLAAMAPDIGGVRELSWPRPGALTNLESREQFLPGPHVSGVDVNRQHNPRVRLDRILQLCDSLGRQGHRQYARVYQLMAVNFAESS